MNEQKWNPFFPFFKVTKSSSWNEPSKMSVANAYYQLSFEQDFWGRTETIAHYGNSTWKNSTFLELLYSKLNSMPLSVAGYCMHRGLPW